MQKKITMNPPRIKKVKNHQNLLLLKWKGNVTVAENEVINLPNVTIRTESRKNGP